MRIAKFILAAAAGLAVLPTWASDEVTDALQAAYAPYRNALFRTNSKAQPESQQAIVSARQSWQSFGERFAASRPPPYDRDAGFGATLEQVSSIYARAEQQIREGQLAQAHETLEAARDALAALRQRNGIVTYSDHMNAYHAEMEHLIEQPAAPAASSPETAMLLMARVGVLEYLARRLHSEAPSSLAADPEFGSMLRALEASVADLRAAALSQEPAAIRQSIGKLKGPYSRMFLKFG